MPNNSTKTKRGFTIIEVVLVLAIAGLIFMMVFIALPALQRSQRDTQRKNDMSRLVTQIINYQSNNRGALPSVPTTTLSVATKYGDKSGFSKNGIEVTTTNNSGKLTSWGKFYLNYLLAGSDTFEDPSGAPYQLAIKPCGNTSAGASCKAATQRSDFTFESGYTEGKIGDLSNKIQNYTISIVVNATCNGEKATYVSGNRKVAVLYKNEGGGAICVNN